MLHLKPSEIFYTQDSINNIFTGHHMHRGKYIGTTLDELADGRTTVDNINIISVKDINGKWFTSDNRRLWVFRNFEFLGGCTYIPVSITTYIDPRKFTSPNGGTSVIVRRNPGGIWYSRLLTNPAKYKNCLLGLLHDPYRSKSKSPSYPMAANNEGCVSARNDIDTPRTFGFQSRSNFSYHEQSNLIRTETAPNHTVSRSSILAPYTRPVNEKPLSVTAQNEVTLQVESLEPVGRKFELNSTVSRSHSANISERISLKHVAGRVEEFVPYTTQKSSERPTSSYESRTGSNISIAQYQERNRDADQTRPSNTDGCSLPETGTASTVGRIHNAGTKLKPASRQVFTQLMNVKQMKANTNIPVTIIMDPSKIRYTKEAIEYPHGSKMWPTVQRRLLDLLGDKNHKPLEAYKAYDLYWIKEENDILWSLKNHPQLRNTRHNLKVLVIEDNDAFLDFMRKEKPWLQISDILQLGQNIELIK
ncbi:hypothetical protein ACJMK2_039120 [Sinanodonta woodiana]|uniref:Uncharacterized protein n=1 Tax=Sinanodonta woodiana TaxID=1069815 RepID=A0ABD3WB09_SINWO